jgi:hypothetical protein
VLRTFLDEEPPRTFIIAMAFTKALLCLFAALDSFASAEPAENKALIAFDATCADGAKPHSLVLLQRSAAKEVAQFQASAAQSGRLAMEQQRMSEVSQCSPSVNGPCRTCVHTEDSWCAQNSWDSLCYATCNGPTSEAPTGCYEICNGASSPTSSPTQSLTDCNSATCSIMGDPHITVFDGAQVSLMSSRARWHTGETSEAFGSMSEYGAGEFWLVSSEQVRIQAHYMPDETLAAKNLFVSAVAVGGPFLRNKTVIIGALGGAVTYDGRVILPSPQGNDLEKPLAAEFDDFLVHATQSSAGDVEVRLPSNVKLLVTREADHVNVIIEMPEQTDGGQDGLCGNFNGLAADDTLGIVAKRFNPKVQPQHSMFSLPAQYSPPS